MRYVLAIAFASALLTGCGGKKKEDDLTNQQIQEAQKRVKELEKQKPN